MSLKTWIINLPNLPNRIMAGYLKRRGWVVFYLDKRSRTCNDGTCWLRLYESLEGSTTRDAELPLEPSSGDGAELCDCGEPFPKKGYCEFCGAHARYAPS